MPPGDCFCNEDTRRSCDSLFQYLSDDFVQDLLHLKCKVVDLAREQIEKSRNSQNCVSFEHEEIARNCACNVEKTPERQKREVPLSKDGATATDNGDVSSAITDQETPTNLLSKILQILATYRSAIALILVILAIAVALYFGFVCSMLIRTSICKKGGFCLPFKIRSTRPRVF